MKLSVSNKNPAMSAVRDPALFAAVLAIPLRSPAYSGAKSLGLLFTATAWNASSIIPTVMIVNAQITEHPMIIIKKNRPPPTKKSRKAKIRLLWNNRPYIEIRVRWTRRRAEVTPGLETLREYFVDSQSDNVAKKMHPSPWPRVGNDLVFINSVHGKCLCLTKVQWFDSR